LILFSTASAACRHRAAPPRAQVLQAPPDASEQQLRDCRRRVALLVHPDKAGPAATGAAQRVNRVRRARGRAGAGGAGEGRLGCGAS
jgi:hypothetical protein